MRVLLLRMDAPLMAFGDVAVDNRRPAAPFPPLSMITGLLANALGWMRWEPERHQRLQERLRVAVRIERKGERLRDYQTVDLGADFLTDTGWTSRGVMEGREGASSRETHIRLRDYWADRVAAAALALEPEEEPPTPEDLRRALFRPARPLFLGRKSCIPAAPLLLECVDAEDPRDALAALGRDVKSDSGVLEAQWPGGGDDETTFRVRDLRDWANQIHVGEHRVQRGLMNPKEDAHGQT